VATRSNQIFATGTSGTIGSRLPKYIIPMRFNLLGTEEGLPQLNKLKDSTLIHLSGIVGITTVRNNPSAHAVNVEGAVRLAIASSREGLARFVYVSSGHVYGAQNQLATEFSRLAPFNEYGKQKVEAETEIAKALAGTSTELVIVRLFSILGVGMPMESLGGRVLQPRSSQQPISIQCSEDIRSFLSIDVAAAHIAWIANLPKSEKVVNLCSTFPSTVGQAVTQFAMSQNVPIPFLEPGVSEYPMICGDNGLLRQLYRDHYSKDPSHLSFLLDSLERLSFREVGLRDE
jgi:nucleoside-diphosphate-sugar epimerase